MRQSFKNIVKLVAVGTMVAGLTACGGSKTPTPTVNDTTPKETAKDVTETEEGYRDYSNGFDSKVTIQIPVYDRAFEGWNVADNHYTKWIQSEFGDKYNINVEFTAIARTAETNDYMQMLASGKAPDIIFHYDMPQALAYYKEGAMQKLDLEEIAYYAPTYWGNVGESIDAYGDVDGDPYFFFAERPEAYNFVTVIRKDWLDAVNKEIPTSLEELNEVYVAWQEAGLGNGGGSLVQNNFTYDYPFRQWPMDEKEHALYSDLSVAAFTWEPTHQYLKNLNYQYNNKLINTEFYLNSDDASTQADFIAGNSGVLSLYISSNTPVFDSLLVNNPEAEVVYLPFSAGSPKGTMPQQRAYWPFGMIMGMNQATSNEERAAVWMYLEWMSDADNLFYLQNGVEGETYTVDAAGLAVKNVDYSGEYKLSNNNNKDYWCLVNESAQYADDKLNYQANLNNWAPVGYEHIIEDAYKDFYATEEYRIPDALFDEVVLSVTEYKSDLHEKWQELYVKCAMVAEDRFEETYEAASKEYLEAGYQKILDEKQAAIDAGKYK